MSYELVHNAVLIFIQIQALVMGAQGGGTPLCEIPPRVSTTEPRDRAQHHGQRQEQLRGKAKPWDGVRVQTPN